MNDVLNDALSNLEHDNYEISYKGYENRQADIALIRAALAAQKADDARDAERWRELDRVASDPDFDLKCDAGGWDFFKGQIDAAIAQQRKEGA